MSRRNHKAIFERKATLDQWVDQQEEWEEVCREWIYLEPLRGSELLDAAQVQAQTTHKVIATHSPTLSTVTPECRIKVRKHLVVDEQEDIEENYRIFQIENVINVREQNRILELTVIEKV